MTVDSMQEICNEYKITMEMLYVMLLMYYDNKVQMKLYSEILTQYREKALTEDEKQALIDLGFLKQLPNKKYITTDKFDDLFVDKFNAANEFFNRYPTYIHGSDGKNYPLKNVDIRSFQDLYNTVIKTRSEHSKLMRVLEFAIENGYGLTKIDVFLRNKMYEQIEHDMDHFGTNSLNTTIDNHF